MSKSTYFTGQPVYSQVIKLLDKAKIQQISPETLGSERYVKRTKGISPAISAGISWLTFPTLT